MFTPQKFIWWPAALLGIGALGSSFWWMSGKHRLGVDHSNPSISQAAVSTHSSSRLSQNASSHSHPASTLREESFDFVKKLWRLRLALFEEAGRRDSDIHARLATLVSSHEAQLKQEYDDSLSTNDPLKRPALHQRIHKIEQEELVYLVQAIDQAVEWGLSGEPANEAQVALNRSLMLLIDHLPELDHQGLNRSLLSVKRALSRIQASAPDESSHDHGLSEEGAEG